LTTARIKRISNGSGRTEAEVRELINQYNMMKKMMKQFGGAAGLQRGQLKDLARQFGFKM
jgi:signal recognition particle subunit SRP54